MLKGGDDDDDEEEEDPSLCQKFLKQALVLEILLGLVGGICMIALTFQTASMGLDAVALVTVILFSVCDARGVDVILATMRVATPTDLLREDIDGEWVLPAQVINSIDVPEYDYEEYEEDGDAVGKGYAGMGETDPLNIS